MKCLVKDLKSLKKARKYPMKYENLSRSIWMVLVVLGALMGFPESIKADNNSVVNMNSKNAIKKAFWTEVEQISKLKGDVVSGEAVFASCEGCHNRADSWAPSLENAGSLYDKTYLIALIKNPAIAMNTEHKYADTMMHPMGAISVMLPNEQDIANVVAYIKKNKIEKTRDKEVLGEQTQSTNGCKSKIFTDLQLAAVEAFEEGDQKKSLELFQEAYHLCPTNKMIKDMIRDLK